MSVSKAVGLDITLLILGVFLDKGKSLDLKFQQNDYELEFERYELVRFNKVYVKSFKAITFKYNRTCPVVNLTHEYKIDVGNDMEVIFQDYVFLSNEYRHFPLRLELNLCEGISKNYAGLGGFTKCGNFTGCPIKKGKLYHSCNWGPDQSQLPPFIPNGRYMLEMQALYHDIELFVTRAYGRVYRPVQIPGK